MKDSKSPSPNDTETYIDLPPYKKRFFYPFLSRLMDIIISITALVVFSPILLITSLLIYLEDKHSPLFVDTRLGKGKKPFPFFKFRSMVVNAHELERKNKEIYKQLRSGEHKVENHPYVTKVGKFIRKYSIDEMPQFINVLLGDMSVVGPRALKIDEEKKFRKENPDHVKYLDALFEVKPGITGFWQVSGRSNIDFRKRMRMEAYYARTHSILKDILILLKTPLAVLKAETH